MAFKIVALLVTLSLTGTLQVRAEWCSPSVPVCQPAPKAKNCCPPARCHCKLSAPTQPVTGSLPDRATTTSHELVTIASAPAGTVFFAEVGHSSVASTADASAFLSTVPPPYLFTHAFLI